NQIFSINILLLCCNCKYVHHSWIPGRCRPPRPGLGPGQSPASSLCSEDLYSKMNVSVYDTHIILLNILGNLGAFLGRICFLTNLFSQVRNLLC
uniref:Uncharacterized protein n=1 Tax=Gadus morhua TaxID=8049 RepID=A0A8C5C690_GADMO